jgi:hypothetical protein
MNSLIDILASAADRGVEVTVITNHREPVELTLRWRFWETRDSGCGEYRAAGYDLIVRDQDGDGSWWELRRGRVVYAHGSSYDFQPLYHFDACCLAAEAALRAEVAKRKDAIRNKTRPITNKEDSA